MSDIPALGKLLQRQLRRSWGVDDAEAVQQALSGLCALADRLERMPDAAAHGPDLHRLLRGMAAFLRQVDDSYALLDRDLDLSRRSLALSSAELTAATQKLQSESAQIHRIASSLRQTLDSLTEGLHLDADGQEPADSASTQSDLESVARRLAQLVQAHEESRQALRTSEQRLALAVQGASLGLWDWNLATDHVYYSNEWAAMLGYTASELEPRSATLVGLLHPDDARSLMTAIGQYFEARRLDTFREEARMRRKDGGFAWVEFTGRVVDYAEDGSPQRATGVSLDISARKAYEQAMADARAAAEAASRAKGDFLANMSHEIRTPMNGILGLTELCLATELDDEQKGYLDMVYSSARSLLTVINDILDFSKIEANRLDIETITFNLPQMLRHAIAPLRHKAESAGLQLLCDQAAAVPEWLLGDPGRLRQVLLNLVGNAVKFTETGQIKLRVTRQRPAVQEQTTEQAWLRFSVSDTGIGIPPERLATVFDAFSQADTSITRRYGGTGLGLTISARLVALMGGPLQVRSDPGQGTEFWFDLKLPVAEALVVQDSPLAQDMPAALDILVAEDHPINQVVARKVLEYLGHRVTLVDNGLKAVEACAAHAYDMVFLDIQMPELDGFGAARRIRAAELDQNRRTPLLAMTAHAMEGYRERCVAGGMDGYVTKPVDRKQLVQEMRRVLAQAARR
jgi:PAS domain S-box-containing protein